MPPSRSIANEEGIISGTIGHDGNNANANANVTELNTSVSGNTTLGSTLVMADEDLQTHLRSMNLSGVQAEPNTRSQARFSTSNSTAIVQPGAPNNYLYAPSTASYAATTPYYLQNYQGYAPPYYALGGYGMNSTMVPVVTANYPSYNSAVATNTSTRTAAPRSPNGTAPYAQQIPAHGAGVQLYPAQNPMYYVQQYFAEHGRNTLNQGDSRGGNPVGTHQDYARSLSSGAQLGQRNTSFASGYYGGPGFGFMFPYGSAPVPSPVVPGVPMVTNTFVMRHPKFYVPVGVDRSIGGNTIVGQTSNPREELRVPSLLEELRTNTTGTFELADIVDHMVEFSRDQHGSRFIQQKLETVSLEEKVLVMNEVKPHALALMTDVFGNYVIQKLFECGSFEQKVELVEEIKGHVLLLSLHMYGCRVIQKALETIDAEHQLGLISELDGHVIECVRDQNGNHVIQKCIECVPPRHISFILSAFDGQVVALCTHTYGCRVIQRVWGRCTAEQKRGIMHEILPAVFSLAEDKYGNYVVQHILEYGEQEERSDIFTRMRGQIVRMSQHKFASNVVEKCFQFGHPEERQAMIMEMLGETDENEPLQAMMKDQYANYVVQKVLETCDGQQRELLLSRIRVHLHSLRKYTYGKHIVARVEKLIATGESHGVTEVPPV